MIESQESTRPVFSGRVIEVRVDDVRLQDGARARREVVVHTGSVAVVALDEKDRVLLVRQFRYPAGTALWEIPAGRIDSGEAPLAAASRELAEETGVRSEALDPLLDVFVTPGYSTERMYIFLASGLAPGPADPDPDERVEPRWFSLDEAVRMSLDGRIRDAKTVAAVLAASARRSRRPDGSQGA